MSQTTPGERVALPCPSCSPSLETVHEVLSTGGGNATVRCTQCEHVHKEQLPNERTVERKVVVSQDGESFTATVDVPAAETLAKGEEFIVETDEAIMEARITDLQVGAEKRAVRAEADDVNTIWARAVDNVSVDVTVNPENGRHDETEGHTLYLPGDHEFTVGEIERFGDTEFTVKSILIREDAYNHGYEHEKLEREGDMAFAKDIQRVYGDDETDTAWSAW